MKERSYTISVYWVIVVLVCCIGHILLFWGFGQASERMSRRVRNDAFRSLVRQDISFFDKRSVGRITSELQEDAARIQTFTGDPVRSFLMTVSSVVVGLILAFYVSVPLLNISGSE